MEGRLILFFISTIFPAFAIGNPILKQRRRITDDCRDMETLRRPQCRALLDNALNKGLETVEGVGHYCENIDFYPHCLRRHTNDYKYMHRCGAFGSQYSMPDTDKWFDMITGLQNGFKEVVCGRSSKDFVEAINCYKHNASYVFHTCVSLMPEELEYLLYENPGGDADIHFLSYTYCSWLYTSTNCIKSRVSAVCGGKTRDLLSDAYRVLVKGVFSRAFDCSGFLDT